MKKMLEDNAMAYGQMTNGQWYIRPLNWAGTWDSNGLLQKGWNVEKAFNTEKEMLDCLSEEYKDD